MLDGSVMEIERCKGSNYLLISKDYSSSIAYFFSFFVRFYAFSNLQI